MTGYETASLTLQGYALIVQVLIGAIQCVLIASGLWLMRKAAIARDDQHLEAKDQHQETMAALQQQGEAFRAVSESLRQQGEAFRQQGEALRASSEALRQQGESLGQQNEALRQQNESMQQQGEALRVLIERTAPAV